MSLLLQSVVALCTVATTLACGKTPAAAPTSEDVCTAKADIVYLIDESGSFESPEFRKEMEFLMALSDELKIGPDEIRVAAGSFSGSARQEFGFQDDINNLKVELQKVVQNDGATNIVGALELAKSYLEGQARADVAKWVILSTDGKDNQNPVCNTNKYACPQNPINVAAKIEALQAAGIKVAAVAGMTADKVDGTALNKADVYIREDNFAKVIAKVPTFAQTLCAAVQSA